MEIFHSPPGKLIGYAAPYSTEQIKVYIERIGLPASAATEAPSISLLSSLQLAHLCKVPFETTPCHLPATWGSPERANKTISLGGRDAGSDKPEYMPFDPEEMYTRVVLQNCGGYCFALNGTFTRLLRSLGFEVSEMCARVYTQRGQDPAVKGYQWTPLAHQCMFVAWPGSDGRYLIDVGFGGGSSPSPVPLRDGAEVGSITPGERFRLKNENLPGVDEGFVKDRMVGWTLERFCGSYWSPLYHATPSSFIASDFMVMNWFNTTHPSAPFTSFLVLTILRPDGSRRSLGYTPGDKNGKMKLSSKLGVLGEETDVIVVDATEGNLREISEREFGFRR